MDLETLWFVLIAVLWAGYFALEGFDFGVGMLLPWVGRDDERPVDDAAGRSGPSGTGTRCGSSSRVARPSPRSRPGTRRCSPGFYVALLLILVFLIIRVVSFEWRSKSESERWRSFWTWCNTIGSVGSGAHLGHRALQPRERRPDRLRRRLCGRSSGPLRPVHGLCRGRGGTPLRLPRRDVPDAPDGR